LRRIAHCLENDARSLSHRLGDESLVVDGGAPAGVDVDSWAGTVRIEWAQDAAMTPMGQLAFFIDFLKTSGRFDAFVSDCPLRYQSPNAPTRRDILGTTMLSMLAGHKRYAHIAALRCDAVLPELLGMAKIVSEDAVRRYQITTQMRGWWGHKTITQRGCGRCWPA
jgi:hypothetical protein